MTYKRGLAMRILSVCPSVKRVDCDKTEKGSVQIFIPYERSLSLVFFRKRMVGGVQVDQKLQVEGVTATNPYFALFHLIR